MLIRRLARPMLAATFVYGGIGTLRDASNHAKAAAPLLEKTVVRFRDRLPQGFPTDPETLVRIDGAIKVGAGAMLAFGKFPRLAALLLAGSLVPTTLAAHAFWEMSDPQERTEHQVHFLKNVGLLGGLLLTAVDTGGKPSVGYRARRRARQVAAHTHHTVETVKGAAKGRK
ncbi:DoxX family protein [Saccharopolyspora hordei]|uniref:Putative membrane protein YphA (DoxX/SURF4 family) n=1 Tax=Saccharopolyspora hordei TaxID=1838 RepID=A0A853AP76_9PSEU|nr:DoxX family membrane protein [Saccharopolyspora hordei]NYI81921.1 putative membrane protein YphA (DoxX/SURF4 family) [Saccharopolyspora hordei]